MLSMLQHCSKLESIGCHQGVQIECVLSSPVSTVYRVEMCSTRNQSYLLPDLHMSLQNDILLALCTLTYFSVHF